MIGFEDLDTDPMTSGKPVASTASEIRAAAHIVNGGEASFPCPACRGNGKFVSYAGRTVGDCFKCKGSGKVSSRVAGSAKAKVTKQNNRLDAIKAFQDDHAAEYEYLARGAEWSDFYRSLFAALHEYGRLTDNQLAAVRNGMRKAAEKAAEKDAAKPVVDVSAIEALFDTARSNGLKRLAFRTEHVNVKVAKETGRNPGALYVEHDGEYVGKIADGKFHATRAARADTLSLLLEVAADPLGKATLYGKQTGKCSCCGRELSDPASVEAGIGPICATKWGL